MTPILGEGRAVLLTPPGITHAKEARDGPQYELKDASRIPLKDRLAWTIPQAASLYGIDYDGLRQAVNQGDIDTFRPPSKRGTPSRRHIRREEMDRYVKSLEE